MAKAEDNSHTANDFANFFADKVEAVRISTSSVPLQDIPYTATHILDSFSTLPLEQVEKMIETAQENICQLDPAPTWIVKECRTLLSPFIARLLNESLATGCFPQRYKHAIITPLLNKSNMDSSQLKSYIPVSVEGTTKSSSFSAASISRCQERHASASVGLQKAPQHEDGTH